MPATTKALLLSLMLLPRLLVVAVAVVVVVFFFFVELRSCRVRQRGGFFSLACSNDHIAPTTQFIETLADLATQPPSPPPAPRTPYCKLLAADWSPCVAN